METNTYTFTEPNTHLCSLENVIRLHLKKIQGSAGLLEFLYVPLWITLKKKGKEKLKKVNSRSKKYKKGKIKHFIKKYMLWIV